MKTVIKNNYTPELLDYCNTLVVDEEKGAVYLFDTDGVFTRITSTTLFTDFVAGTILGSTEEGKVKANPDGTGSVNGFASLKQDVSNLAEAMSGLARVATTGSYNDLRDKPSLESDKYNAGALLNGTFNDYAGLLAAIESGTQIVMVNENSQAAVISATNNGGEILLKAIMTSEDFDYYVVEYLVGQSGVDEQAEHIPVEEDVSAWIQSALSDNTYDKEAIDQMLNQLEGQIGTVSAEVPVITMTTVDPGEGVSLAPNHFIGVYNG